MRTFVGIPYVNRMDLLERAIACVPDSEPVIVLNNSGVPVSPANAEVITPLAALTFTQTMNAYQGIAVEREVRFWLFMHNDATASAEDFEKVITLAESTTLPWSVIFTNYDALAAFNVAAFKVIGPWDQTFTQYFADNDYYRRAVLSGYPQLNINDSTVKHDHSQTLQADPHRRKANDFLFPAYQQYYIAKWGGDTHKETFSRPWNQ